MRRWHVRPVASSMASFISTGFNVTLELLMVVSWAIVGFIMVLITADVLGRYLFSTPIIGTLELTEAIMPFAIFFALAHAQASGGHIRVSVVTGRLPYRLGQWVDILAHVVALAFFGFLTWYSGMTAVESWQYREASEGLLRIPLYPAKFGISIGSAAMALQLVRDLLSRVRLL